MFISLKQNTNSLHQTKQLSSVPLVVTIVAIHKYKYLTSIFALENHVLLDDSKSSY